MHFWLASREKHNLNCSQIFDNLLHPLKRSAMKLFALSLVSLLVAPSLAIVIDSPDGADCFSSTDAIIEKEVVSKV